MNQYSINKNPILLTNLLFITTLFILYPIIDWLGDFREKEYFITTVGLWSIFNIITRAKRINKFHCFDILFLVFVIYQIIHFNLLSNSTFWEVLFWWRLSFAMIYFIFKDLTIQYYGLFKKSIVTLIIIRFTIELTIGSLQYLNIISVSRSQYFIVTGTFTSTNHYAICLGLGLVTLLIHFKNNIKNKIYIVGIGFIGILSLLLILHSKSRSAFLGILTVLIAYFFIKRNFLEKIKTLSKIKKSILLLLTLVILFISSYFAYNLKKDSVDGRVFCSKITLKEIIKKPFFGNGLFTFEEGYNTAKSKYFNLKKREWSEIKIGGHISHAMNDYLEILYEIGILGFILLFCLIFIFLKKPSSCNKNAYNGHLIVIFLIIAGFFTTLVTNSFFILILLMSLFLKLEERKSLKNTYNLNNNFYIILVLITSLGFTIIGSMKIYCFKAIKTEQNKKVKTAKYSDWRFWTEVIAYNGYYKFTQGVILHGTFKKKKEALIIMEKGVLQNKKIENIRKLALYNAHSGNLKKAEELLLFNIGNAPYLFEPKHDLAIIYQKSHQNKKYTSMLREIINYPEKVPSKKVTYFKNDAKKRLSETIKN